jgi:hypothetical protein
VPTAVTWLLDVVPPDYRLHGVLRRHPLALAVLARHHLAACVHGAREGYRTARTELASLPPGGVDAVLEVYRAEGRRLVETARAVDLVGRALRGEVFTPQLGTAGRSAPGKRATRTGTSTTDVVPKAAPPKAAPPRDAAAKERATKEGAARERPAKEGAAREGVPDKRHGAGRRAAKSARPS